MANNLSKMKKADLEALVQSQMEEIEDLKSQLVDGEGFYGELENQVADLSQKLEKIEDDALFDVKDFKWRLQLDGLLTPQLDDFIENYLKFHNKLN